jgi:hypothetical protein
MVPELKVKDLRGYFVKDPVTGREREVWDEENMLTIFLPARFKRPNVVLGGAVFAHFSYFTQREYIENATDLRGVYAAISRGMDASSAIHACRDIARKFRARVVRTIIRDRIEYSLVPFMKKNGITGPIYRAISKVCFAFSKIAGCVAERRWPNKLCVRQMVSPVWYLKLRVRNKLTRKVRVGFGPIFENEINRSLRKARVDMIVDHINGESKDYSAGVFFGPDEWDRFDIVVITRLFTEEMTKAVKKHHGRKIFIFDIVDHPAVWDRSRPEYAASVEFISLMDALIASSPLHLSDFKGRDIVLIEHPVQAKRPSVYRRKNTVDIIWQGFRDNMVYTRGINPIARRVKDDTGVDVRMIYNTDIWYRKEGMITYTPWNVGKWDKLLASCDIGIVVKPVDDKLQQRKPSSKISSYMGAGLPVICTPSESDKLVIKHGETGFFAYTDDDWYHYLKLLVTDPGLRKKIGQAGREFILKNYSTKIIGEKYSELFDRLCRKAGGNLIKSDDKV